MLIAILYQRVQYSVRASSNRPRSVSGQLGQFSGREFQRVDALAKCVDVRFRVSGSQPAVDLGQVLVNLTDGLPVKRRCSSVAAGSAAS